MSKFVVQSGGLKHVPGKAHAYFSELLKNTGPSPKLLWCFFATLPDPLEERFEYYTKLFSPYFPEGVSPINTNAYENTFAEQVKEADVVYMHGGSVEPLLKILEKHNIEELFQDKVIGTNSASTLALSSFGWDSDRRKCIDGYGLLHVKTLVHYNAANYGQDDSRGPIDWISAKKLLEEYGDPSLPVHALEEGDFIVVEQ